MPKRNIAWMLVIILIATLFWKLPQTVARRDEVYRSLGTIVDIRREILKNYVEEVEEDTLVKGAIEGMLQSLDRYSSYFPPEHMEELKRATTGSFGGIGIEITMPKDGWPTVISPMDDTPALHAGILAGDRIIEIDGESTKGLSITDAVKKLTGRPGTKVTLTVRHELKDEEMTVTLTRDVIKIVSVKGWERKADNGWDYMIDPDDKIGYVRISKFMPDTPDRLNDAVKELMAQGMRALIIDLRFNPGGLLESAIGVSDLFLSDGVIVSTRGRWSQKKDSVAKTEGTLPDFPMVVLVNRYSASAAEIVAGALRDHNRAIVIGERTFGKGSVQNVIELED
ncbi:MAG: S41 family peptidase, partial [Phycisphaerae bacterium]|nr:S41 family peptidase [Phycisphaerae bacterium]